MKSTLPLLLYYPLTTLSFHSDSFNLSTRTYSTLGQVDREEQTWKRRQAALWKMASAHNLGHLGRLWRWGFFFFWKKGGDVKTASVFSIDQRWCIDSDIDVLAN